jgi:hypothetical protein
MEVHLFDEFSLSTQASFSLGKGNIVVDLQDPMSNVLMMGATETRDGLYATASARLGV